MKVTLIIVIVLIAFLLVIQLFTMTSRNRIEKYPFSVLQKFKDFEIRSYEARLFTAVELPTNEYKKASGNGFRMLAGYIFGGNKRNEKIAMTSPVAMTLEDSMTMMFMVPQKFKREDLPEPNQSAIKFREEPAKIVAAIKFSGWASSERITKYKNRLTQALNTEGIAYTQRFYFFGYNPPYDMVNRRNEIIVELEGNHFDQDK